MNNYPVPSDNKNIITRNPTKTAMVVAGGAGALVVGYIAIQTVMFALGIIMAVVLFPIAHPVITAGVVGGGLYARHKTKNSPE